MTPLREADSRLRITLNGEAREVAKGERLVDLLVAMGLDPRRVAVEHNRDVVPRAELAARVLADGDTLEVVHFVGGG